MAPISPHQDYTRWPPLAPAGLHLEGNLSRYSQVGSRWPAAGLHLETNFQPPVFPLARVGPLWDYILKAIPVGIPMLAPIGPQQDYILKATSAGIPVWAPVGPQQDYILKATLAGIPCGPPRAPSGITS